MRGVCVSRFNSQRQLLGPRLGATDSQDVTIEQPASADPFDAPTLPLASLLRFSPGTVPADRVKISGTVLLQRANGDLFVTDGAQGTLIRPISPVHLEVGDSIEAIGFPALGATRPILEDVLLRPTTAKGSLPQPCPIAATSLAALDRELVSVEGRLLEHSTPAGTLQLVLESGSDVFTALLIFILQAPDSQGSTR